MASLLPAMRGRFGSTEFFIVTMPAKEFTERVVIPEGIEGWEDLSIEERCFQRDINYRRVKQQIAPYLTTDDDRFFGAFIVSILNAEGIEFEPSTSIIKGGVPVLYKEAATAFGFLSLKGSEVMVPLDGQHRLAALMFAISGKDEKQQPIAGVDANSDVANDDCTVILIKHDDKKSRKIFNKVNRYAKKTTKAEDLITSDDDVIAVIVRESVVGNNNIIPARLVNVSSNTLTARAIEFTTLATLYEGTRDFLEDLEGKRISTDSLPNKATHRVMEEQVVDFWTTVCDKVHFFNEALADPYESGDEKRKEIRADFLLGKPVGQWALVQAILRLCREDSETGTRISLDEACRRINQLDWSNTDRRWQQVLLNGDRVLSGRTAVRFATSQVISYWLGETLSDGRISELQDRYARQGGSGELEAPSFS